MEVRKCASCGKDLCMNYYLCADCYGEKRLRYMRVLAYSEEQDYTRIYDYLDDGSGFDIDGFLGERSYTVIAKDTLPYFFEGNLPLLSLYELDNGPVMRRGVHGYPKSHIIEKNNEFAHLYIQVATRYYISTTVYGCEEPTSDFEDCFTRTSPGKCLLCDEEKLSYDHYLCYHHYYDNKNLDLFFKLNVNKSELKQLSTKYEGIYTCKDGHIVKSQAEELLDNYFFENNIKHAYEPELCLGDENITVKPDFAVYLDDEPIYIEYWGVTNQADYDGIKSSKLKLYKNAGITLINIYSTPLNELIPSLLEKLSTYEKGQVNFEE